MASLDAIQVLATLPALRGLAVADREAVAGLFEEIRLPKGQVVVEQGAPGDALYVVVSGVLEALENGEAVGGIGPGEWFGEMALLTGAPRSATVKVALDCRLLKLGADAFAGLTELQPRLHAELAAILSRRLARRAQGRRERQFRLFAIENRGRFPDRRALAEALSAELEATLGAPVPIVTVVPRRARVAARREGRGDALVRPGEAGPASLREAVAARVADLRSRAPCVLLEVDERLGAAQAPILELAHTVVAWSAEPDPEPPAGRIERSIALFERDRAPAPPSKATPGVALGGRRAERARGLASLARRLVGRSVGVALGSGAAYGLAHIGVLGELERHGVPVDFVAGASVGSVVGALYALGTRPDELREMASILGDARALARSLPRILGIGLDFNLVRPGLFSGDRFARELGLATGLAGRSFADLSLPFRAVATDVETGARVEFGDGPLMPAIRASCSAPWILSPARVGDRVLIDGGMCDPVPSETVRSMGADHVIAVNVVPPPDPRARNPLDRLLQALGRRSPLSGARRSSLPNSFDVVARTLQIMQHELGNERSGEADFLICPDLSRFWLLEFWRAPALVEAGAAAAAAALPEIQKRLAV